MFEIYREFSIPEIGNFFVGLDIHIFSVIVILTFRYIEVECYYANLLDEDLFRNLTFPTINPSSKLVILRYFNETEQNLSGENLEFELFMEVFNQLDEYTAKMMIFQVNCDKERF